MEFSEAQDFFEELPSFEGFLGGRIWDCDCPTEEVAKKVGQIQSIYPDELLKEMKSVVQRKEFPWEAIGLRANYNLGSEEKMRNWLQKMIDIIEANRPPEFRKKISHPP